MTVAQFKRCTKCGIEKSHEDFYIKDRKTGRRYSWCKTCHKRITTANSQVHRVKYSAAAKARRAADPVRYREIEQRYRDRNRERINQAERERAATPEVKAKRRAYREANRERIKAQNAEYRKANADAILEANRAYRAAHPEVYRKAARKWQAANPEETWIIKANANFRRRAREANAIGRLTAKQWKAIKIAQDFTCRSCGKREPEILLTIDHIIPLVRGGTNESTNIQGLCGPCNSRKKDRIIKIG